MIPNQATCRTSTVRQWRAVSQFLRLEQGFICHVQYLGLRMYVTGVLDLSRRTVRVFDRLAFKGCTSLHGRET